MLLFCSVWCKNVHVGKHTQTQKLTVFCTQQVRLLCIYVLNTNLVYFGQVLTSFYELFFLTNAPHEFAS